MHILQPLFGGAYFFEGVLSLVFKTRFFLFFFGGIFLKHRRYDVFGIIAWNISLGFCFEEQYRVYLLPLLYEW